MSKKILQDVVKIRNIKQEEKQKEMHFLNVRKNVPISSNFTIKEKKKSYNILWFVALISVLALFFAISFLFSNAVVTINPKTKDFVLNKTFTATKNTNIIDELTYDLVVLSGEENKEIKGGEEKDWEVAATGGVLVYNSLNSPQTLLINTRLEGSNGKIYKTKSKVIIPATLKTGTPGKIQVDIYAEKAGSEYNSTPLDFKILGFRGTSKYSKIYARSVGDITGGLLGKSSQVSDIDKEKAIEELKSALFAKLFEKAKNQIPENFILLNGATFFDLNETEILPITDSTSFTIKIKGTFNGILFNKEKLEKEIVDSVLDEKEDKNVYVSNINILTVSSFDKNLITLTDLKDISFNLSGSPKIIWKVDQEKLIEDLLGKSKKDFNQVLLQYPNIDFANSKIRPIWSNSFPDKNDKIKITINDLK